MFVVWGILAGPVFYPHYAAFVVPFLVALAAVSIGRLRESLGPLTGRFTVSRSTRKFVSWAVAVGFVGLLVGIVMWSTIFYSSVGEMSGYAALSKIPQLIPPGACVVYDNVGYGILENRFFSEDAACPKVIDPIGTRLLGGNETTTPSPRLIRQWKGYFETAQYVVTNSPEFSAIPTDKSLQSWFQRNYHVLYNSSYLQIFEHDSLS